VCCREESDKNWHNNLGKRCVNREGLFSCMRWLQSKGGWQFIGAIYHSEFDVVISNKYVCSECVCVHMCAHVCSIV